MIMLDKRGIELLINKIEDWEKEVKMIKTVDARSIKVRAEMKEMVKTLEGMK